LIYAIVIRSSERNYQATHQRRLIEAALVRDGLVSVTAAWDGLYGAKIRRLGARICELRNDGWQIKTKTTESGETFYILISKPHLPEPQWSEQ
jgi:hypothetical protein